jgi:hypothetical protein
MPRLPTNQDAATGFAVAMTFTTRSSTPLVIHRAVPGSAAGARHDLRRPHKPRTGWSSPA